MPPRAAKAKPMTVDESVLFKLVCDKVPDNTPNRFDLIVHLLNIVTERLSALQDKAVDCQHQQSLLNPVHILYDALIDTSHKLKCEPTAAAAQQQQHAEALCDSDASDNDDYAPLAPSDDEQDSDLEKDQRADALQPVTHQHMQQQQSDAAPFTVHNRIFKPLTGNTANDDIRNALAAAEHRAQRAEREQLLRPYEATAKSEGMQHSNKYTVAQLSALVDHCLLPELNHRIHYTPLIIEPEVTHCTHPSCITDADHAKGVFARPLVRNPSRNRAYAFVYTKDGTFLATFVKRKCTGCNRIYEHGAHIHQGRKVRHDHRVPYLYVSSHPALNGVPFAVRPDGYSDKELSDLTCVKQQQLYFRTTKFSAFSIDYLDHVDNQVYLNHNPFIGLCNVYNRDHAAKHRVRYSNRPRYIKRVVNNMSEADAVHTDKFTPNLQRRRLNDAFFEKHIVELYYDHTRGFDWQQAYPAPLVQRIHSMDWSRNDPHSLDTRMHLVRDMVRCFPSRYIFHQCNTLGCKQGMIVLDGNEKIYRSICAASYDEHDQVQGIHTAFTCGKPQQARSVSAASLAPMQLEQHTSEHGECASKIAYSHPDSHPVAAEAVGSSVPAEFRAIRDRLRRAAAGVAGAEPRRTLRNQQFTVKRLWHACMNDPVRINKRSVANRTVYCKEHAHLKQQDDRHVSEQEHSAFGLQQQADIMDAELNQSRSQGRVSDSAVEEQQHEHVQLQQLAKQAKVQLKQTRLVLAAGKGSKKQLALASCPDELDIDRIKVTRRRNRKQLAKLPSMQEAASGPITVVAAPAAAGTSAASDTASVLSEVSASSIEVSSSSMSSLQRTESNCSSASTRAARSCATRKRPRTTYHNSGQGNMWTLTDAFLAVDQLLYQSTSGIAKRKQQQLHSNSAAQVPEYIQRTQHKVDKKKRKAAAQAVAALVTPEKRRRGRPPKRRNSDASASSSDSMSSSSAKLTPNVKRNNSVQRAALPAIDEEVADNNASTASTTVATTAAAAAAAAADDVGLDAFDAVSKFNCNNADRISVQQWYYRTAGVLFAVKPCGVIAWWEEMYTSESLTHVALMMDYHYNRTKRARKHKPRCVAYDRACQFEKVVNNMLQQKYLNTRIWGGTVNTKHKRRISKRDRQQLEQQQAQQSSPVSVPLHRVGHTSQCHPAMLYMVDEFHVAAHTTFSCKPPADHNWDHPDQPGRYHPKHPKFKALFGDKVPNTEVCEQTFKWLGKYAHIVKYMTAIRFWFFLTVIVDMRNQDVIQRINDNKLQL